MKVGILGFGTVGSGVYDIITSSKYNDFTISKILVRDKSKYSKYQDIVTTNCADILDNNEIDLVVEVMGGHDFAYECIKRSLKNKKHVVTANKDVVSKHLEELLEIAHENNVCFLFEAAVAGGLPIINNILNNNKYNKISSIDGILNGSTNYILSLLQIDKVSYTEAINKASELGYLEADPTDDLEGIDMVRKIAILSMLSYHCKIDLSDIYNYPISNVSNKFIDIVNIEGYTLKYMASSLLENELVGIRIEPVLITNKNIASSVNYETNVVNIKTSNTNKLTFSGPGAGSLATGSAIVSDMCMVLENRGSVFFKFENDYKVCKNEIFVDRYVLDATNISMDIIDYYLGDLIVTKPIEAKVLKDNVKNIKFYARIGE